MDEFEKWMLEMVKQKPELVTGWPCLVCGQDPEVILTEVLSKYRAFKAKAEEPLAVLADRKGAYIAWEANYEGEWHIGIDGTRINQMDFKSPTYASAEAKAREWLNKQEDK